MSDPLPSGKTLRLRRLVSALNTPVDTAGSAEPARVDEAALEADGARATDQRDARDAGGPADADDCFVCDLIEQRLGRRSTACGPSESDEGATAPTLSAFARVGYDSGLAPTPRPPITDQSVSAGPEASADPGATSGETVVGADATAATDAARGRQVDLESNLAGSLAAARPDPPTTAILRRRSGSYATCWPPRLQQPVRARH